MGADDDEIGLLLLSNLYDLEVGHAFGQMDGRFERLSRRLFDELLEPLPQPFCETLLQLRG